ncbi:C40 family peptidase [Paenisporosarcina cavernae]|nr:C40 family peptidase [Paenisporosarcina cavernae]
MVYCQVPITNVWTHPSKVRKVDDLMLQENPNVIDWLEKQTLQQRKDLAEHCRIQTQLNYGEKVEIDHIEKEWACVYCLEQPTSKQSKGYPGWVLRKHLTSEKLESDQLPPNLHLSDFLGKPYCWGGLSKDAIDCSGLVYILAKSTGNLIPRDAKDQVECGFYVSKVVVGDCLFFGEKRAQHVGIAISSKEMIHAPCTGKTVEKISIADYKTYPLLSIRRGIISPKVVV